MAGRSLSRLFHSHFYLAWFIHLPIQKDLFSIYYILPGFMLGTVSSDYLLVGVREEARKLKCGK